MYGASNFEQQTCQVRVVFSFFLHAAFDDTNFRSRLTKVMLRQFVNMVRKVFVH